MERQGLIGENEKVEEKERGGSTIMIVLYVFVCVSVIKQEDDEISRGCIAHKS